MRCPDCDGEMTEVYSWVEHPGPGEKMIGHPGPLKYYECEQCGTKINTKEIKKKETGE